MILVCSQNMYFFVLQDTSIVVQYDTWLTFGIESVMCKFTLLSWGDELNFEVNGWEGVPRTLVDIAARLQSSIEEFNSFTDPAVM